jgi:hypothetical protein
MNYSLNTNWLFSKQFKAATATLLLAASMLVMMGLPIAPIAQAATTGTVELSSEANGDQFFGNATLSITVSDSDIGVQELKGTYNPSVTVELSNATTSYNVNVTQNTGGTWVGYVTDAQWVANSCASLGNGGVINHTGAQLTDLDGSRRANPGFATFGTGANGIITGNCAKAYVNSHHLSNGVPSTRTYSNLSYAYATTGDGDIAEFGFVQAFNFTRGQTITITYKDVADSTGTAKDVSKTVKYKDTNATIYNTL